MIGKSIAQFPKRETVGPRNWGEEILAGVIPGVLTLKLLKITKGNRGGLQYHRLKQEAGLLLSGKLLVRFENGSGEIEERIVEEGESFVFPRESVHQEIALEDCVIVEASSPHLNDRVRVEQYFGEAAETGLPTTKEDEIVHL